MARALSFATALAGLAAAAGLGITMDVPPSGSAAPITGTVTGTTGLSHKAYKVAILTSGDNGVTFWDKSHTPYFLHQVADPSYAAAGAQNAAVVIKNDWTFRLKGYDASPYDATSDLWVAMVVPSTFDMSYPKYQIEGGAIAGDLLAAAECYVLVSKSRGTLSSGAGGLPAGAPGQPAPAPPAASPAASPAAHPSPAASPAAASPAAAPSTAASPAAAPSTAASPAAASPAAAASHAAAPSHAALPAASGVPGASHLPGNGTQASSGAASVAATVGSALAAGLAGAYLLA